MSFEFQSWLVGVLKGTPAITSLVGQDSDGNYSIFPYHSKIGDVQPNFPKVTVARFGSSGPDRFKHDTSMDYPRIAVCVWSQDNIETCWRIYRLIDPLLRGQNVNISNQYFGAWEATRTTVRDDLFDQDLKAFHLHSEYAIPVQTTAVVQA
jgi:hypothetical protein